MDEFVTNLDRIMRGINVKTDPRGSSYFEGTSNIELL